LTQTLFCIDPTNPKDATMFHHAEDESSRIADMLELVAKTLPLQRRVVRAGDTIYRAGEHFGQLFIRPWRLRLRRRGDGHRRSVVRVL
jgi:hypothetical protein